MNASPFMLALFAGTILTKWAIDIASVIGNSFYALRDARNQRTYLQHPYARRSRERPLISIIVPTKNQGHLIEECLLSILASSYRNHEIIVVDNVSNDDTQKIVTRFAAAHPKKTIHLLRKRKHASLELVVHAGFKKWAKGDHIMTLSPDKILETHALRNAARHFAVDDSLDSVIATGRILDRPFLMSKLQQFDFLTSNSLARINLLTSSVYSVTRWGTIVKRAMFKHILESANDRQHTFETTSKRFINISPRSKYASDVVVYSKPARNVIALFRQQYTQMLHMQHMLLSSRKLTVSLITRQKTKLYYGFRAVTIFIRYTILLIEPILISYLLYAAIYLQDPILYALLWAGSSFVLCYAVWTDSKLSLGKKIKLSLLIPVIFNLRFIKSFGRFIALLTYVFSGLRNVIKKLLGTGKDSLKPRGQLVHAVDK